MEANVVRVHVPVPVQYLAVLVRRNGQCIKQLPVIQTAASICGWFDLGPFFLRFFLPIFPENKRAEM